MGFHRGFRRAIPWEESPKNGRSFASDGKLGAADDQARARGTGGHLDDVKIAARGIEVDAVVGGIVLEGARRAAAAAAAGGGAQVDRVVSGIRRGKRSITSRAYAHIGPAVQVRLEGAHAPRIGEAHLDGGFGTLGAENVTARGQDRKSVV